MTVSEIKNYFWCEEQESTFMSSKYNSFMNLNMKNLIHSWIHKRIVSDPKVLSHATGSILKSWGLKKHDNF